MTAAPLHVAVNAQLLSPTGGYRQAGVSAYIELLLRHLPQAAPRARWTVYAPPGVSSERLGSPAHMQLRPSRFDTSKPLTRIAWEQLVAPLALMRDRPDVLLCPLNVMPLLAPCPCVVTVHDLAFLRFNLHKPAKRRYLATLTNRSVRRARHVITVSEFTRQEVLALLDVDPDCVTAIPNGRDTRFRPQEPEAVEDFRAARELPERFVLFVGTLEPRKNLPTLLRAYAKVRAELAMPLVIGGGKGWLYDEIFALVRELGLERDVRFLGFVESADLPLLYAAATAFVYPSLYEGFGFPPLEAMATGTPVLISDTGALREVVGEAGLSVPAQDVDGMAAALLRITRDTELRVELREKGLERAQQFSWERASKSTAEVLHAAVR